jgi:hypothetical protein
MTSFNKAIAAFLTGAVPSYAAFSTSCSGVFGVFGTNGTTAEFLAAGIIGLISGGIVWLTPNKPTVAIVNPPAPPPAVVK